MTTKTFSRLRLGNFVEGIHEVIATDGDVGMKFRLLIIEAADAVGLPDSQIEEELALLLDIRLEARRRREELFAREERAMCRIGAAQPRQ